MSPHGVYWNAFVLFAVFLTRESLRQVTGNSHEEFNNEFCQSSPGCPELDMYQIDPRSRSIGSNVSIVSEFTISCEESPLIQLYTNQSEGFTYIGEVHANCSQTIPNIHIVEQFPHLNISNGFTSYRARFTIVWFFNYLPEHYNGLELITSMGCSGDAGNCKHHTLTVIPCESSTTISTFEQMSIYNITSTQLGYFGDFAKCHCLRQDEILFHLNGTRASTTAQCAYNAVWSGCEELQCWSEPQNVTIAQLNQTTTSSTPFRCSFHEGFPLVDTVLFKIDDEYVSELYELKSSDHGKNVSCEVISDYTSTTGKKAASSSHRIIVYYPPENSVLSDDFVSIDIDSFKILNFIFYANPEAGKISLTVTGNSSSSAGLFLWNGNYLEHTRYIYELVILVSTPDDYGSYNVCASTSRPPGLTCSQITLKAADNGELRLLVVLVSVSVAGVITLFVIGVAVLKIIQTKRNNNAGTMRETEMTSNDGYTEYETNDGDQEYDGIGPAPRTFEIQRVNSTYAEVI